LEREVRSGDPKNVEARAARVYWSAWLDDGESFRRRAKALDSVNAMLNYGYAVLRAAVARALVSAGLQPAIGLHHSNRGNPFCLADDLMEPLRPLVDARVRRLRREGVREINPDAKKALLGLLAAQVRLDDEEGPLMVALHRTAASLVHCLRGAASRLLIPVSCDNGQP
jgi:CRISPR-associated protein Cas1